MKPILVLHDEDASVGVLMEGNKARFTRWAQGGAGTRMFKLTAADKLVDGVSKGDVCSHVALVNTACLPSAIVGTDGSWRDRDANFDDETWTSLVLAAIMGLPDDGARATCVKVIVD